MQRICPGHTHNIALSHTVLGSRSCVQCTIHAYNPLRPAAARGAPAWLLHDGALNKPLAGGASLLLPTHYPFITQRRPRQDHKSPTSTAFLLRSWRVTPVRICRKLAIVRRHSSLRRRASCLIIVAAKMSAICCDRFVTVGSVSELSFRRRPSSCLRWLGLNGMSASGAAAAFLEVRRADDSTGTRRGSRGSATTAHDATNTTNTRTPRPSCISKLPLVRLGRTALSPAAARDRRLLRRRQCRACCAWPSRLRATVCLQIRCRRCPCRGCVCAKGLAKCSGSGAKRAAAAAVCRCRCGLCWPQVAPSGHLGWRS